MINIGKEMSLPGFRKIFISDCKEFLLKPAGAVDIYKICRNSKKIILKHNGRLSEKRKHVKVNPTHLIEKR